MDVQNSFVSAMMTKFLKCLNVLKKEHFLFSAICFLK